MNKCPTLCIGGPLNGMLVETDKPYLVLKSPEQIDYTDKIPINVNGLIYKRVQVDDVDTGTLIHFLIYEDALLNDNAINKLIRSAMWNFFQDVQNI